MDLAVFSSEGHLLCADTPVSLPLPYFFYSSIKETNPLLSSGYSHWRGVKCVLTSSLLALSYSKEQYAKDNTRMIFFST